MSGDSEFSEITPDQIRQWKAAFLVNTEETDYLYALATRLATEEVGNVSPHIGDLGDDLQKVIELLKDQLGKLQQELCTRYCSGKIKLALIPLAAEKFDEEIEKVKETLREIAKVGEECTREFAEVSDEAYFIIYGILACRAGNKKVGEFCGC